MQDNSDTWICDFGWWSLFWQGPENGHQGGPQKERSLDVSKSRGWKASGLMVNYIVLEITQADSRAGNSP